MSAGTLAHYLRCYDGAFDSALCARMIESFRGLERHQRSNGQGHRVGLEQSAWTELDLAPFADAGFKGMLLDCVQRHWRRYVDELKLTLEVPFTGRTSEWIVKRYRPGGVERFQTHFDSIGAVSNRYLVFLWYLNDVERGGATRFPDLGIEVEARAGRLLMFPPYWMFQHEGVAPASGDKYILSTYLLF
jgi:hypothetical protein